MLKFLEKRFREKISQTNDIDKLAHYQKQYHTWQDQYKIIKLRMKELLKKELPQINDIVKLMNYWREFDNEESEESKRIEVRMIEIIQEITDTDIYNLIFYWKNVPEDSEPEELMNDRISEAVENITDIDKLCSCLEEVTSCSTPRELIEDRINELSKKTKTRSKPEKSKKTIKKEVSSKPENQKKEQTPKKEEPKIGRL